MRSQHLIRFGAVAALGLAFVLTALAMRGVPAGQDEHGMQAAAPRSDGLAMTLRHCAALGDAASSDPLCRHAWEEKRRRFLGLGPAMVSASARASAAADMDGGR